MKDSLSDARQGKEMFRFSTASRPALWHNHRRIQWFAGAVFPAVMRQEREANHPLLSSAFVAYIGQFYLYSCLYKHGQVAKMNVRAFRHTSEVQIFCLPLNGI
jgi:hypothetical protein